MTKPAIPPIEAGSPPLEDLSPDSAPPYHHSPSRRLAGHVRKTKNMTFEDRTTQPTTKKPFYKRWWFITIAVILALTLAFLAYCAIEAKKIVDAEDTAYSKCKNEIEQYAKYPGGITYPSEPIFNSTEGAKRNAAGAKPGEYAVSIDGEVDLVNGFGTPVRHYYHCSVVADSDGFSRTAEFDIDEDKTVLLLRRLDK